MIDFSKMPIGTREIVIQPERKFKKKRIIICENNHAGTFLTEPNCRFEISEVRGEGWVWEEVK